MKKSNVIQIIIYLTAPADTKPERDMVHKYVESSLSSFISEKTKSNIDLKVIIPEKSLTIASPALPQDKIHKKLIDSSDIFVGIFWTRFDTNNSNNDSDTVEEINYCLQTGKPVRMYFLGRSIPPNIAAQYGHGILQMTKFKERSENNNLFKDVFDDNALKEAIDQDLELIVNNIISESSPNAIPQPSSLHTHENDNILSDDISREQPWYEKSITKLIQRILADDDLKYPIKYLRHLSHDENINFWRDKVPVDLHHVYRRVADAAREEAFSIKYGNFDYKEDLRSRYRGTWHEPILDIIKKRFANIEGKNVLAVASNYGLEVEEIFGNNSVANIDILELCKRSIKKGKGIYKNITFLKGNMEDVNIENGSNKYDLYLNLRSIHSRGVSKQKTMLECHRLLKYGGVAIISISNGYLTPSENKKDELVEKIGMYDHVRSFFSKDYPWELANEIRKLLQKYQFKNVGIRSDSPTEIIIFGTKG